MYHQLWAKNRCHIRETNRINLVYLRHETMDTNSNFMDSLIFSSLITHNNLYCGEIILLKSIKHYILYHIAYLKNDLEVIYLIPWVYGHAKHKNYQPIATLNVVCIYIHCISTTHGMSWHWSNFTNEISYEQDYNKWCGWLKFGWYPCQLVTQSLITSTSLKLCNETLSWMIEFRWKIIN
jgi:hypothetical protein